MNEISSMQCLFSAAPHIEEDTVLSILMYDTYHRVLWVWVGIRSYWIHCQTIYTSYQIAQNIHNNYANQNGQQWSVLECIFFIVTQTHSNCGGIHDLFYQWAPP